MELELTTRLDLNNPQVLKAGELNRLHSLPGNQVMIVLQVIACKH